MNRSPLEHIDGPEILAPAVHGDARGFFIETHRSEWGLPPFVQDNHSRSARGVVRGMHFMLGEGAGKLVRCGRGEILDVVVDLRRASPTFGRWEGVRLDDREHRQLWIPAGFAHGFCVLSEVADVLYKQTAYYDAALETGFAFDDPEVGIAWPLPREQLVHSERDATAPRLSELAGELPF